MAAQLATLLLALLLSTATQNVVGARTVAEHAGKRLSTGRTIFQTVNDGQDGYRADLQAQHVAARKKPGNPLLGQLDNSIYPAAARNCFKKVWWDELNGITNANKDISGTLIRMLFHDSAAGGLNGSIMKFQAEKDALTNRNLEPAYPVIEQLRAKAASQCGATPTYADTIVYAASLSMEFRKGPSFECGLGRKDKPDELGPDDPGKISTFLDSTAMLINDFAKLGLNTVDLVLLSAAHTVGKGSCFAFSQRFDPPDPTLKQSYRETLQGQCAAGPFTRVFNDPGTPYKFDNNYFQLLQRGKGLFTTDQGFFTSADTRPIVIKYANDNAAFIADFQNSFCKMSRVGANIFTPPPPAPPATPPPPPDTPPPPAPTLATTDVTLSWKLGTGNNDLGTTVVTPGSTVTWLWDDNQQHTVLGQGANAAEINDLHQPGVRDGWGGITNFVARKGFTVNHAFMTPGDYAFTCGVHGTGMRGVIRVTA